MEGLFGFKFQGKSSLREEPKAQVPIPSPRTTSKDEPTVLIEVPGDESELNQYEMGYESFLTWLGKNHGKKYNILKFWFK